ncbi:MAG: RluA family pseudouridine synthase [Chloroflexi bacterium]|nr:RluA family pseudouridine synthase [Chloroflexota bacterium]
MQELVVGADQDGRKLIAFLRRLLPGVPLSGLHKMLRTGRVRLNGRRAKPNAVLRKGDRVSFAMREADFDAVRYRLPEAGAHPAVDVVHLSDDVLVVSKPRGVLTHPGAGGRGAGDTLVDRVQAWLEARGESLGTFRPVPVHRLDRGTSGLVVFARTAAAARALTAAFRAREARKEYLAAVRGHPGERVIDVPLARDEARRETRAAIDDNLPAGPHLPAGARRRAPSSFRPAVTRIVPLAVSDRASLLRVEPSTGRTHQIRVHLAYIGAPLWGDEKYGGPRFRNFRGFLLHAWRIEFPGYGTFVCPPPDDWRAPLAEIQISWPIANIESN